MYMYIYIQVYTSLKQCRILCVMITHIILYENINEWNKTIIEYIMIQNIIKSYQRYEIDSKIVITSYATERISERLTELTKQMEVAEKNLAQYKEENGLVDTGDVKELKIKQIENYIFV